MNKILKCFCVLFLLQFVFFGCQAPPTALTESQKAAIADTVRQIALEFKKGINNLDADSQFQRFTDDSDFTWAANGYLLPPKNSLLSAVRQSYAGYRQATFDWDTLRISVLGSDAAVLTGAGHHTIIDKAGKTTNTLLVATYAFARRQGAWKVIHGHFSYASPSK